MEALGIRTDLETISITALTPLLPGNKPVTLPILTPRKRTGPPTCNPLASSNSMKI